MPAATFWFLGAAAILWAQQQAPDAPLAGYRQVGPCLHWGIVLLWMWNAHELIEDYTINLTGYIVYDPHCPTTKKMS